MSTTLDVRDPPVKVHKRQGPKPKPKTWVPIKPVTRVERSYSKRKKEEVMLFLLHHKMPDPYHRWSRDGMRKATVRDAADLLLRLRGAQSATSFESANGQNDTNGQDSAIGQGYVNGQGDANQDDAGAQVATDEQAGADEQVDTNQTNEQVNANEQAYTNAQAWNEVATQATEP